MARSAILNVMVQAVLKAGRALIRDFGEVENLQVSRKGPGDFVSSADHKAERILREELMHARPTYGALFEESGESIGQDKDSRWIVDPLDGTKNFLHGIPLFSISVALEREGVLVAGVIYSPIMDELYTAERGRGAFLNDRRLRVAGRRRFSDAVVALRASGDLDSERRKENFKRLYLLMNSAEGIRQCGSVALDLAWLAAGRFDAVWHTGVAPWDIAAGILLIRESGGFISDLEGQQRMMETGDVLAGNAHMHTLLQKQIGEATKRI